MIHNVLYSLLNVKYILHQSILTRYGRTVSMFTTDRVKWRGEMANRFVISIFWALFGVFILLATVMQLLMGPPLRQLINDSLGINFAPALFFASGSLFFVLGLTLLILAIKADTDKILKRFLILTGAAAVGIFASILLHNLVYGAFTQLFGEDFWERTGIGDEPFFFIMAIFICPIAYLVGTVGSIVLMFRRRKHE